MAGPGTALPPPAPGNGNCADCRVMQMKAPVRARPLADTIPSERLRLCHYSGSKTRALIGPLLYWLSQWQRAVWMPRRLGGHRAGGKAPSRETRNTNEYTERYSSHPNPKRTRPSPSLFQANIKVEKRVGVSFPTQPQRWCQVRAKEASLYSNSAFLQLLHINSSEKPQFCLKKRSSQ